MSLYLPSREKNHWGEKIMVLLQIILCMKEVEEASIVDCDVQISTNPDIWSNLPLWLHWASKSSAWKTVWSRDLLGKMWWYKSSSLIAPFNVTCLMLRGLNHLVVLLLACLEVWNLTMRRLEKISKQQKITFIYPSTFLILITSHKVGLI